MPSVGSPLRHQGIRRIVVLSVENRAGIFVARLGAIHRHEQETIMIVRRLTWFYRVPGQNFAQKISFKTPVTASKVREVLRRTFHATAIEIWSH